MLDAAQEWWINTQGFAPVEPLAHDLKVFERPWYISSGWALDLFLGRVTRVHHDVDFVVARTDQRNAGRGCVGRRLLQSPRIRGLSGWFEAI